MDNAQVFKYKKLINFFHKYKDILSHSTTYYPQGNGLAKSSNKALVRILKKTIAKNKNDWDSHPNISLW